MLHSSRQLLWCLILMASGLSSVFAKSIDDLNASPSPYSTSLIQSLIADLGNEEYLKRRDAESRLLGIGVAAFDELQAAEFNPDLEIATRARYILYQIRIQWIRPNDNATVRKVFSNYGSLATEDRRQIIRLMVTQLGDEALGPLCRIARFDPSPQLCREAALVVLQKKNSLQLHEPTMRATILREIGEGQSPPTQWLRVFADQILQRNRVDPRWSALIDTEIRLLKEQSEETQRRYLVKLLDYHRDLAALHDSSMVFDILRRRVDLLSGLGMNGNLPEDSSSGRWDRLIANLQDHNGTHHAPLASSLVWTIENEQWDAYLRLEEHYATAFDDDRLLLYLGALAHGKQENVELSEQYLKRVFEFKLPSLQLHNSYATIIGALGRHDWAEREWRLVIDRVPLTEEIALRACIELAILRLHDRQEYQEGVDLLTAAIDAIETDEDIKNALVKNHRTRALVSQTLPGRKAYLEAFARKAQGDHEGERKFLDKAYQYSRSDPDIMIAMYHSEDASEDYQKRVRKQITHYCSTVELAIEKNGNNTSAQLYNIYAWLVSNTEGDYQKALQYSLRSLELQPGDPSYLDTLGRCYYAVGDLDNAIKYQRRAVAKQPHLQVMRRQLKFFEAEKAQSKQFPKQPPKQLPKPR